MVESICGAFLNCNDIIGIILGTATQYTTGDVFITFLIPVLFFMGLCIAFGIRLEYSMIIILPLLFAYMTYLGGAWIGIGAVILIYLAIILTYNFFIR